MKNHIGASAFVLLCFGAGVMAQGGVTTQAPRPTSSQPTAAATHANTTLYGCVYQEKDIPGRAPNVAERVGILEDYILADVTTAPTQAETSTATPRATGTSGTVKSGAMYKLELVSDDKLQAFVGKRVEVSGRIDAEAGDKPATSAPTTTTATDRAIGRDRIDLPEFEVTSIRETTGTCAAMPSAK